MAFEIGETAVKRHRHIGLTDQDVMNIYENMLLARVLDERMWLLNRAGKLPFVVSGQGQEGAQAAAAYALDKQRDVILPYYRDLAMVLAFGETPLDILLANFGRANDLSSGGRQMPGHFSARRHRIFSQSSPVTTQLPHAAGIALAARMRGEDLVTYVSFGEGSSNQGDFHEACNFAGVHKLPVIFFCENNHYAISVPLHKQIGSKYVADRAAGYGFPGIVVDGNDVLSVYAHMKDAVERALRGEGPTLIEALTYRLHPHSSDDDDRSYRSKEEVEAARARDALVTFRRYMIDEGVLTEQEEKDLRNRLTQDVDRAIEEAERSPLPAPESALNHVYADGK